jgi:hypothetical protein
MQRAHHIRKLGAKQLDDGIADTLVSVEDTRGILKPAATLPMDMLIPEFSGKYSDRKLAE